MLNSTDVWTLTASFIWDSKGCRSWLMSGHGYMHLWSAKKKIVEGQYGGCLRYIPHLCYVIWIISFCSPSAMNIWLHMKWPSYHTTRPRTDLLTSSHVSELRVNCWSTDDYAWWLWLVHLYLSCFRWLLSSEAPGDKGGGGIWICERLLHWRMYNVHCCVILSCNYIIDQEPIMRGSVQLSIIAI